MSDESTQFILGDAAADATSQGRRGLFGRKKKRKVASVLTHCENCAAALAGEFCAQCGQHAIDYRRSLWRVLIDAADSFLNWDTKFLSSIGVLLTRPWKLTNDFNAGRRARYVHPLRLYLLASITFFLMLKLAKFDTNGPIELRPQDRAEIAAALGKLVGSDSVLSADQQAKVDAVRTRLTQTDAVMSEKEKDDLQEVVRTALASKMKDKFAKHDRAQLKAALRMIPEIPTPGSKGAIRNEVKKEVDAELAAESAAESAAAAIPDIAVPPLPPLPADVASPSAPPKKKSGIHFGPEDKEKTPFGNWMESRIKDKVGEDGTKSKLFLETLRNNIPTMMLCCIPLFALVLKILYIRKGRYYVEHLVYALHVHTFAYLGVTVIVLACLAIAQVSDALRAIFATFAGIAMFVLVFLSIRRVYGEGWFFTTLKFLFGSIAYAVILIVAVGLTAFITLLLPN